MKKILAIVLVLTMVFALCACATKEEPKDSTPPASSPNNSSAPPASPDASDDDNKDDAPAAGGTIGYVTDDVDHQARDPYKIVYFNYRPTNVTQQVTAALEKLGAAYNFTIEQLTANGDSDAYINNLTTILIKEPDGLIIDITQELAPRVSEICSEYDTPAICIFNKAVDADGHAIIPSIAIDQFVNGYTQMAHLMSVYKDYWGDIDTSEIALIVLDWSSNMDLSMRGEGALAKWKEEFGDQTNYYGDTAASSLSPDAGYNAINSIISAHPEVKYWFIAATVEDIALGGSRAVEALGKTDCVLMTSSGAATLPGEWDSGYDGVWIANYAVTPFQYAGLATFGLFALIEGRATIETLWPEHFADGDKAARFMVETSMMTLANYKEFTNAVIRSFNMEP